MSDKKDVRVDIDILKGISIIAVIMYHVGIVQSGYLGVDCFFVINGFLTIPKLWELIDNGDFIYFKYIWKKIGRLYPPLIVGCLVCLGVGAMSMIPDDFENVSESIVASLLFANNFLQGFTLRNYWNTLNIYRPLMHTWYLGIVMQLYIIIPIILLLIKKICRVNTKKTTMIVLGMISFVSYIMFILPIFTVGQKFYYIPFRFYEIALGGIVGIRFKDTYCERQDSYFKKSIGVLFILFITLIFGSSLLKKEYRGFGNAIVAVGEKKIASSSTILPNECLVSICVILTIITLLWFSVYKNTLNENILSVIGKRSYSFFIWHQIILAFYRYYFAPEFHFLNTVVYIIVTGLLTELSYRFLERRWTSKQLISWCCCAVVLIICSTGIYFNAGVIRDVPELDIDVSNVHRDMHAEYNDKVFEKDVDFSGDERKKVLVIGNSFGRDFVNILCESQISDELDISYIYKEPLNCEFNDQNVERIKKSDYVFVFMNKTDLPDYFWSVKKDECKVFGIGTKTFGQSNGAIYIKRLWLKPDDYYNQTIIPNKAYERLNDEWSASWGRDYINLMETVRDKNGKIKVFTPNRKLISQDCMHLTKNGAKYYAELLDLKKYFDFEE